MMEHGLQLLVFPSRIVPIERISLRQRYVVPLVEHELLQDQGICRVVLCRNEIHPCLSKAEMMRTIGSITAISSPDILWISLFSFDTCNVSNGDFNRYH
jgi:hypothetical protein